MRILVLGGSLFLSHEIAAEAARRGHDVVGACRGSDPLPDGVEHVVLDRADPDWSSLDGSWDAVVETQESPAWVAAALDALADRTGHWTYVSSISVYADDATPGGTPDTLPLREPVTTESDSMEPEVYGGHKVACERLVVDATDRSLVVRPGLIVGPGDPTGRFTYWPVRLADSRAGDDVLAPGDPADPMQVIDVRDLAAWQVDAIESGLTGTYDLVGPRTTMGELLGQVAAGVGSDVSFTWVSGDDLDQHEVAPWMGERAVPLWLPQPEYAGMVAHEDAPARAVGLLTRSIAQTSADTLAWVHAAGEAGREVGRTGLSREAERAVLESVTDA
ncbi:epimerase [Salsipaludibacter albus]|uniref:epimerase n=1 Tax=Salsipaludibacter albus TaxID=2849650 RepID=UPI001EE4AC13|nr:epimerase [Salsipaludibacter albus]MBY5162617.1 epimerase [Salsipaludibacter albus]